MSYVEVENLSPTLPTTYIKNSAYAWLSSFISMFFAISIVFQLLFETNQYSCFMQKVFMIKESVKALYYDQISCCVTEETINCGRLP